ncbi:uracil-DNA glycosylase family protein [Miltoncostaea marina]|uniref:uracil-DNA glycosylase family protein n=1 Tax=Miltoncostaea marina TaxID=2843215 RepID=UPI001C3CA715|nr:uracil-DNA glycosylase family protein [Miltoncostaea marina]
MTPEPPSPHTGPRTRARRAAPTSLAGASPEDIQEAYQRRAIAEMAALNDEIGASEDCGSADELPVMSSGSPQAQIMLVKWSASLAERQEGVAFFGRAGTAILKSVQRLGIDPLELYGTLCVKCGDPGDREAARRGLTWLAREVHIVQPALIVPMGERVVEALGEMGFPLAEPLRAEPGEVQRWTPAIEALFVPDIDASLDEQGAKRAFWQAFRAIGDWHQAQPPY